MTNEWHQYRRPSEIDTSRASALARMALIALVTCASAWIIIFGDRIATDTPMQHVARLPRVEIVGKRIHADELEARTGVKQVSTRPDQR